MDRYPDGCFYIDDIRMCDRAGGCRYIFLLEFVWKKCDTGIDPDRWTGNRFDHHTVYVVIKNEDNLEKYNAVAGCI